MKRKKSILKQWLFNLGETSKCLENGQPVLLPHTWNIEEGREEHWGTGWYQHDLDVPKEWEGKRIWLHFGAVYHTAVIYVNDKELGRHEKSGYTPFSMEMTDFIQYGCRNKITVMVSNQFREEMLPYKRSFDWANDGGIIREVCLYVTGEHCIKSLRVTATPVITTVNERQDEGSSIWGFDAVIDGSQNDNITLDWELIDGFESTGKVLTVGSAPVVNGKVSLGRLLLENMKYWHFDYPNLYLVRANIKNGTQIEDTVSVTFGIRDFHVKGSNFYLNGERVRLCGTEWMPGSDPSFGMAEPANQLEKMLTCLKSSNCVFTRFHWQQDEFVYDWCDRNGILVQEEVPFWGGEPAVAGETQWNIFKQQVSEMVHAHYNHPSVVAWGVGNELDAQAEETISYIRKAVSYLHELDSTRTANYVSNSFYWGFGSDGTSYGDIMMINEYTGTWMPDHEPYPVVKEMIEKNPGKPLVIAEFGLCEPAFRGGDERRTSLFLEKMEVYRQFPEIAGVINFCLNDYRTQMGEDGIGKYKSRVHGSTYLNGEIKPSYLTLQRKFAPFIINWEQNACVLLCREDLPAYTMKGYTAELLDEKGMVIRNIELPLLQPGDKWRINDVDMQKILVYGPQGFLVNELVKHGDKKQ